MIIIGEKLNGSIPAVGEAIARRDAKTILSRARAQSDAGADYLDVCASVEESKEEETLRWMIELVQSEIYTPLCIDSPSPRSIRKAIPYCKRTGIVNSVSMEKDKIDVLFPAIADTKWGCVALLCDDLGIPTTVERRMRVFSSILERAKEYGISEDRLYIDPLVVALSTDQTALTVFTDCCRRIRDAAPNVHITSGLSNISFGLPCRKSVNQAFLALAMQSGMDSAILDPTNQNLMGVLYATRALLGEDEYCLDYIGAYREGLIGPVK